MSKKLLKKLKKMLMKEEFKENVFIVTRKQRFNVRNAIKLVKKFYIVARNA
uniref:Uncharacterized protein n=1 Tax=Meloidogyne enterolobii TaxID=390850 RepID=A0A6V7WHD5_MELEN|nr:unnamed protein product [Meloidogyne enterolobii]